MRVWLFFTVRANIVRSTPRNAQVPLPGCGVQFGGTNCGAKTWLNAVDAAPASRRQRPASKADAYTTFGSIGSSFTSLMLHGAGGGCVLALPSQTLVKCLPASVDS